ncbi:hypothetical protein [Pedobacter sp. ASV28]|uniref:hypothetical protein n=1 Tax=Pedobacter sp. ASV28 TaxID=2795123 RepID=UPI001E2C00BF|nr:hypothetical protein [Pedobacter sp. ASV28]
MQIEFPQIKTERLILDQPRESDIVEITSILHNELYAQRTINIPFPYTLKVQNAGLTFPKPDLKTKIIIYSPLD